jgi:putative SOS response-associated peptidase YedK
VVAQGERSSYFTSGCRTIPCLHLLGCGISGEPSGAVIGSCSILTTTPNSLLADIHDRMPVVLCPENYDLWLDPGFKDVQAPAEVLVLFDAAQMRRFPVSTRINAVTNDDPDCILPTHSSLPAQSALFG